ncbi:MAG: hypothetical protein FJW32_13495 [Acidobacteria bacterium]|nr:hypothetical protein [Acidobacteriota bacterium]
MWAFGAVVYEMVTGRKAFEGQNYSSLVTAIVSADPPPMPPVWLDRLVRRCLAKDPEDRWQSMRDVTLELRTPPVAEQSAPVADKRPWVGWALAAVLAAALVAVWAFRGRSAGGEAIRFTVNPVGKDGFVTPPNTTVGVPQFALAPNGSAIVYVARSPGGKPHLWLRSMADTAARQLAGTEEATHPFWSPDSQWIGYFSEKQLRKIPAAGGAAQTLATDIADSFGASWAPDNAILFAAGANGISRITASGGVPTAVTAINKSHGDISHRWPHFLPDGKHFLYYVRASAEHHGLYLGSLDGTPGRLLLKTNFNAIYAPPGYLLFVEGDILLAQRFDPGRLEVQGEKIVIASGVGKGSTSLGGVSASATGLLAHAGIMRHSGDLTWFDRRGNPLSRVGARADYLDFRVSPSGKRLAFSAVDEKTNTPQIWIGDLERGNTSPITFEALSSISALWSPDGERITFRSTSENIGLVYQQGADGGGKGRRLLTFEGARAAGISSIAVTTTDWSPDGQTVLFSAPSQASGFDIWAQPAGVEGTPARFIEGPGDQGHANISADGKLVAYSSNESGRFEVYVQTLPLSGRKAQVSTAGGFEPRWRADGREIYYIAADGKLMAVSVAQGLTFGVPRALFQTQYFAPALMESHYVPDRDGQRFLVNAPAGDGSSPAITVTLNWAAGLK